MSKDVQIFVIIMAAGSSSRMATEVPKPYLPLHGMSILERSVRRFLDFTPVQNISVVINPNHLGLYESCLPHMSLSKPVFGGKSRQESVLNGLRALHVGADDIVLIHDAARPFVLSKDILRLLDTLNKNRAASLCFPIVDSIVRQGEYVERSGLQGVTTPQGFRYGDLIEAHENCFGEVEFTDDASLVKSCGIDVEYVLSSRHNFKITTTEDYEMAHAIISQNSITRTASGFDVHAFESEEENKQSKRVLKLGGLTIDHPVALKGHSDADVVLHAVTDAILGGCCLGDIGTHFPPSDPQWKDVDSALFLHEAVKMMSLKGGVLEFVDITILAEAPKVGPVRDSMREHIAGLLGVSVDAVSIKATTTEGLGFVGRKEGVACQALATLSFPADNSPS